MSSGFSRYVSDFEVEAALKRSKLEADILETNFRRSRIEANLESESALRRSRKEASHHAQQDASLRRSRIES